MIDYNRKAVGKTIRDIRTSRGLSQEVLSGMAGIARSHLSMIETGSKHANFETIWKISNAFGIKTSDFVKIIENNITQNNK